MENLNDSHSADFCSGFPWEFGSSLEFVIGLIAFRISERRFIFLREEKKSGKAVTEIALFFLGDCVRFFYSKIQFEQIEQNCTCFDQFPKALEKEALDFFGKTV